MAGLYSYDVMNANLSTRCWERTAVGNITSQQGITPGANLTVLSINLSCHLPLPATRFHAFLQYIKGISPMPDIILFQEFHHQALGQLQNDEFVRNNYTISNLSTYEWGGAQQGTLAMWRRTLPIKYTGRLLLPYTASNQSVLVLDFLKSDNTVFRIVTARTELEYRDHQITAINQYLVPGIASYSPTSALLLGDINREQFWKRLVLQCFGCNHKVQGFQAYGNIRLSSPASTPENLSTPQGARVTEESGVIFRVNVF